MRRFVLSVALMCLAEMVVAEPIQGVQIGAATQDENRTVSHPLASTVTVQLRDSSLKHFLSEIARQSGHEFIVMGGIGECSIAAFIRGRMTREVLQLALEAGQFTYQGAGRSNRLLITPITGQHPCPTSPDNPSRGNVAGLSESIHIFGGANFMCWGEALNVRVDGEPGEPLGPSLKMLMRSKELNVRQVGTREDFAIRATWPKRPVLSSVAWSTHPISITPSGISDYIPSRIRVTGPEPAANPVSSESPSGH